MIKLENVTLSSYFSDNPNWNENLQKKYFNSYFRPKYVNIITHSNQSIGAFSFINKRKEIVLFYLYILPQFQNKGIGTSIFKNILTTALKEYKTVKLAVLKKNVRAIELYTRLSFNIVNENDTHYFMEWIPYN
ncbi:MAG: GNAT family N-acetyltransferase [Candidatus Hermodarchaeota archaeon]